MSLAWLNGVYVSAEEARISPFDRGFLLADSVYEVTAVFNGKLIDLERHMIRLERSLKELKFAVLPDRAELEAAHTGLIEKNDIEEGLVYLQVTRGSYAGRDFYAPAPDKTRLTVFMFADKKPLLDTKAMREGVKVISSVDIRWGRRDIKTTQLLASSLAKTEARAQGADDAWLMTEGGEIYEGASSNAWIVTDSGEVITRALSNAILAGVTRNSIMDALAGGNGLKVIERSFTLDEVKRAKEAFQTGAGGLVTPVVAIDGQAIGSGRPGPVTRLIQRIYFEAIGADVAKAAPFTMD
jgi:D-alanine transaminase